MGPLPPGRLTFPNRLKPGLQNDKQTDKPTNRPMKIRSIHITAGRGFNHPREQFANFKFDLHLQAELEEGEDPAAALVRLQEQGEQAAEAHKARILEDIERKAKIEQALETIAFERRKAFDNDASKTRIAEAEAVLAKLTATPCLLGNKIVHPGHPDHPDTEDFGS